MTPPKGRSSIEPILTPFWITTSARFGPLGYGVTAWSLADALWIIRGWGYELPEDAGAPTTREGVAVADLDRSHVVANMGPIVVRGMWYPFVGLGVPRWMND